jgi:hypothetical protein
LCVAYAETKGIFHFFKDCYFLYKRDCQNFETAVPVLLIVMLFQGLNMDDASLWQNGRK